MFKQRLITALVLIPAVFGLLFFASPLILFVVTLLFLVVLGLEWQRLVPFPRDDRYARRYRNLWLGILLGLIWPAGRWLRLGLELDLLLWAGILLAVLFYPRSQKVWGYPLVVAVSGWVLLPVFACCMMALYLMPQGKALIVYVLVLVWSTDIGAYLAGKMYGQHKLMVQVSPGKTIEGSLGGIVLAMIAACLGAVYLAPDNIFQWLLVSFVTVLMAMLGDLSISMLKRRCQLKDTGAIFPGHGGALDRLDSLIAALPVFFVLYAMHPLLGS